MLALEVAVVMVTVSKALLFNPYWLMCFFVTYAAPMATNTLLGFVDLVWELQGYYLQAEMAFLAEAMTITAIMFLCLAITHVQSWMIVAFFRTTIGPLASDAPLGHVDSLKGFDDFHFLLDCYVSNCGTLFCISCWTLGDSCTNSDFV